MTAAIAPGATVGNLRSRHSAWLSMFGSGPGNVISYMDPKFTIATGSRAHDAAEDLHPNNRLDESIERAVATVSRHFRLRPDEADELRSEVWLKVLRRRRRLLRQFRGHASLRTYLTRVARNIVLDQRSKEWGKWRPSSIARRHGAAGIVLDRLIRRDGLSPDSAVESLLRLGGSVPPDATALIAALPPRPMRRVIEISTVETLVARDAARPIQRCTFGREQPHQRVRRALVRALQSLPHPDRDLIVWRFAYDMRVSEIAELLGIGAKPLYRRLARILTRLQSVLRAHGIDTAVVATVVEDSDTDLNVDLKRLDGYCTAPPVPMREAS